MDTTKQEQMNEIVKDLVREVLADGLSLEDLILTVDNALGRLLIVQDEQEAP